MQFSESRIHLSGASSATCFGVTVYCGTASSPYLTFVKKRLAPKSLDLTFVENCLAPKSYCLTFLIIALHLRNVKWKSYVVDITDSDVL